MWKARGMQVVDLRPPPHGVRVIFRALTGATTRRVGEGYAALALPAYAPSKDPATTEQKQ